MIHTFTGFALIASYAMIVSPDWRENANTKLPAPTTEFVDDTERKQPTPVTMRDLTILFANDRYGNENARAFVEIIYRESRFNHDAENPTSGAYGLGQALPPEKMASAGDDWKTNPMTQLKWVARYIEERYGTPIEALRHHNEKGWY
jgi:hypothetical protein